MSQSPGVPQADPLYADLRCRDARSPAIIVDVREREEFAAVRVEGSLHIPLSQFAIRTDEVPRDRPILVICASGSRSMSATAELRMRGWDDVASVAGGIGTWERMGLPVRRGPLEEGEGRRGA